ncbi:hypothetical protein QYF36_025847 [Acer negundo]|nr:hypothetical protein QYF36_025847 [Acer negundo]
MVGNWDSYRDDLDTLKIELEKLFEDHSKEKITVNVPSGPSVPFLFSKETKDGEDDMATDKVHQISKPNLRKLTLKLEPYNERGWKKALKTVSRVTEVESVSLDMKDKKLTVFGDIDPIDIVSKLRKFCTVEVVSVGPAIKPEKKKEKPKKAIDKKKEDAKLEDSSDSKAQSSLLIIGR